MDNPTIPTSQQPPKGALRYALAANTLDKATTYIGLTTTVGVHEFNPAFQGFMELIGVRMGIILGLIATSMMLYLFYHQHQKTLLYIMGTVLLGVGIWNLLLIGGIL